MSLHVVLLYLILFYCVFSDCVVVSSCLIYQTYICIRNWLCGFKTWHHPHIQTPHPTTCDCPTRFVDSF